MSRFSGKNIQRLLRESQEFLEQEIQSRLAIPVKVVVAQEPISLNQLSSQESNLLFRWKSSKRRDFWRRGREALQKLSEKMTFPHSRFSLTHSGDYAIAVGTSSAGFRGIGIDFEPFRKISFHAGRFFLTNTERVWVERQKESQREIHLLRLWTVKEALFKSCGGNGRRSLTQFVLGDPGKWQGNAVSGLEISGKFSYLSLKFLEGFVSIAIFQGH